MRNERGITLVALVVTIVVLLILAGVTITYALGNGGLFSNAQKALSCGWNYWIEYYEITYDEGIKCQGDLSNYADGFHFCR